MKGSSPEVKLSARRMSERSKFFEDNQRKLAERLEANRPRGVKGLAFVLTEILKAQQQGLLRPVENADAAKSKFANILMSTTQNKLSKQDKSKELIKVLRKERTVILERLMRDSVI